MPKHSCCHSRVCIALQQSQAPQHMHRPSSEQSQKHNCCHSGVCIALQQSQAPQHMHRPSSKQSQSSQCCPCGCFYVTCLSHKPAALVGCRGHSNAFMNSVCIRLFVVQHLTVARVTQDLSETLCDAACTGVHEDSGTPGYKSQPSTQDTNFDAVRV